MVLQDAWIELNEIAEIEPKFFQSKFKLIFENTVCIVNKTDFTNPAIRQQPIEFYVTVVERIPSIVKKNHELLKALLETIFKLMIDIDADIEQSWLRPKEGFKENAEGEDMEDNVQFGRGCIDKIVSAVGDEITLPILSQIVTQTMENDTDWRYKNAGLMAFSQVGEYIDDVKNIGTMLKVVIEHLVHPNPKIRYASLHCIGQLSDDMTEDFQEAFGNDVLPALIAVLDDPVPRVSAHCASAITNFMDGVSEELAQANMQNISMKLGIMMKNGISIQKENSVTAFAQSAVAVKEAFDPHFAETVDLLLSCLDENPGPEYKQFRAQVIEAITLICCSVSDEAFFPHADRIVNSMIYIQKSNLEQTDPQRSYLLTAWQRICTKMKGLFTPFLHEILPSILSMASLKPKMGIEGAGESDIEHVLSEIKPEGKDGEKKASIMTDAIEEKDTAIQMLIVFVEELEGACFPYLDQISEIMVGLTQFDSSDNIRNDAAGALPSLLKCAKAANQDISVIHELAKKFSNNLVQAMESETETDCLIQQSQALKEIIETAGQNLLQLDSVDQFSQKVFEFINQSESRVKENNKYEQENLEGEEEDQLDEEDLMVLKEENKNEQQLQLDLGELFGMLFKTHKDRCTNLVQRLITEFLPEIAKSDSKQKQKFLLFVLDDMIEYLGPSFLGPVYPQIVQQVCTFTNSP